MPASVLKIESKTALEIAALSNIAVGDVVFQTTDPVGFYTYNGTTWGIIDVNPGLASALQFTPLVKYADVDSQSPDIVIPDTYNSVTLNAKGRVLSADKVVLNVADNLTGLLPVSVLPELTGDITAPVGTNATKLSKINSIELDTALPLDKQTLVFDNASNKIKWSSIVDSTDASILTGILPIASLPAFDGDISITSGTNTATLVKIQNVVLDTTAPVDKQALVYDGVSSTLKWTTLVNSTDSGILTGTLPITVLPTFTGDISITSGTNTATVTKINNVDVDTTTPIDKQALVYDTTTSKLKWTTLINSNDAGILTGTLPITTLPEFTGDISITSGTNIAKVTKINNINVDTTAPVDKQALVYDTASSKLKWTTLINSNDAGILTGTLPVSVLPTFTGDIRITSGTNTAELVKIQNVVLDTTAPVDKQALVYDGASSKLKWTTLVNSTDSGILTGTLPVSVLPAFTGDISITSGTNAATVTKINNINIDTTIPVDKQALVYDTTTSKLKWTTLINSNDAGILTGTLPVSVLPTFTGDAFSTSGTNSLSLSNTGVVAGEYDAVTVDAKGRVISGKSGVSYSKTEADTKYDLKLDVSKSDIVDGYAKVQLDGKISGSLIPVLPITNTTVATTATELTAQIAAASTGDVIIDNVTGQTLIKLADGTTAPLNAPTDVVTSINGKKGKLDKIHLTDTSGITDATGKLDMLLIPQFSGDITNIGAFVSLSDTGVPAGEYSTVTVDSKGRVITGKNGLFYTTAEVDAKNLLKLNIDTADTINGYAKVQLDGKISGSLIPVVPITNTTVATTTAEVTAQIAAAAGGDVIIDNVTGQSLIVLADGTTAPLTVPTDTVTSINGKTGNISKILLADTGGIVDINGKLDASLVPSFSGDVSNIGLSISLNDTGINAGEYSTVTVDVKGRVISGNTGVFYTKPEADALSVFKLDVSKFDVVDGYAKVQADGKINSSLMPVMSITSTTVANTAEELAAQIDAASTGDVIINNITGQSLIKLADGTAIPLSTPTDVVSSINGKTGNISKIYLADTFGVVDAFGKLDPLLVPSFIGDITNTGLSTSLSNTGVSAGEYSTVTVDAKGRVISGKSDPFYTKIEADAKYDLKLDSSKADIVNGYVKVQTDGKINSALIPTISITNTTVANTAEDVAAQIAAALPGDVIIDNVTGISLIKLADGTAVPLNSPTDTVTSINGKTGIIGKIALADTSGITDATGKLDASLMPSFVGDVINTGLTTSLANTGVVDGIYNSVTVNSKGLVIAATNQSYLKTTDELPIASLPGFSGDVIVVPGTNTSTVAKINNIELDTSVPVDKQALVYDVASSKLKWTTLINSTDAGILTGTLPVTTLPEFIGDISIASGTNIATVTKINNLVLDVTLPIDKQALVYDGLSSTLKWTTLVDSTDASILTGILPITSLPAFVGDISTLEGTNALTVSKINGTALDTTLPVDKQALVYDGVSSTLKWTTLVDSTDASILTGTLPITALPEFIGDISIASGTNTAIVTKINNLALDITLPIDKQALVYDGVSSTLKWTTLVDSTDASILTGTLPITALPEFIGDISIVAGTNTATVTKINNLALDVTLPIDKQALVYDGLSSTLKWTTLVDSTDASILTGTLPITALPEFIGDISIVAGTNTATITKLNNISLDTTLPIIGQTLKYDGTNIIWSTAESAVSDILSTADTIAKRTITGSLSATQFNSTELLLPPLEVASKTLVLNLNAEYINNTKINNAADIGSLLIGGLNEAAWYPVTGDIKVNLDNSISVSKLNGTNLDITAPANNQILSYNGTDAIWSSAIDDSLLSANIPKLVNGILDPLVLPPLAIASVDVYTSDATGLVVGYTDNDLVNNTISIQAIVPTFLVGDVVVLSDVSKTFILSGITDAVYNWTQLVTPIDGVAYIGDQTGIIQKLNVSNINILDNTVNSVVNNANSVLAFDEVNGAKWSPLSITNLPAFVGTDIITNATSKLLELTEKFTSTKTFSSVTVDTKGRISNGLPVTNVATSSNMVLTSDGTTSSWKIAGLVDATITGTMGTDSLLFSTAENAATWRNLSGDISINTDKSIAVKKINGTTIGGTPAVGAVITADSTSTANWVVPVTVKVVTVDFISSYYTVMVNTQYAISITGVVSLAGVFVDHFLIHMDDGVNITEFTLLPDIAGGNTATYLSTSSSTASTIIVTITAYDTAGNKSDPVSKTYRTVVNLPPVGTVTASVVASVAGGSTGNTITFGGATDNENNQIYYKVTPKTTTAFTFSKSIGILPNEPITFSVPLVASAMDISFIVTAYDTFGGTENDGASKTFSVSVTTNVIGIVNTNPVLGGGLGGAYVHADMNGNTLIKTQSYFDQHPCYQFTPVTIDGQSMVTIPKFYYKVDKILSGTNANKYGLWISDIKLSDSWNVHPAFMNNGVEIPHFYYGRYQASVDYSAQIIVDSAPVSTPKLKSVGGVVPEYSSATLQDYKAFANNRNTDGSTGFMVHSFWQRSAIQMLSLVEKKTLEMASATNRGAYVTVANDQIFPINVSLAGGSYRGIEGLWGNISQLVDGLYVLNQALYVWDTTGAKDVNGDYTYITQSGYTVPIDSVATKFQYPIAFKAGSFFDACFITESNTVQSVCNVYDLQFFRKSSLTTKYFATVGGSASEANNTVIDANWTSNTDRIGMYYLKCSYTETQDLSSLSEYIGTRLAKI